MGVKLTSVSMLKEHILSPYVLRRDRAQRDLVMVETEIQGTSPWTCWWPRSLPGLLGESGLTGEHAGVDATRGRPTAPRSPSSHTGVGVCGFKERVSLKSGS